MKIRMFAVLTALLLTVGGFAQSEPKMIETPHIVAQEGAFAKTVLMPGDPLRAKYIAENFLENAQLITSVRNMLGYTGTYKGVRVSVMASGMGMPSIGIYSWELFTRFGVENIIRVGSAGSYKEWLDVMDVTLAESAVTESTYAQVQGGVTDKILTPNETLNDVIKQKAIQLNIDLKMSKVRSSDVFYSDPSQGSWQDIAERTGSDCVEMESFALFHNANMTNKRAATLLTISDSFVSHKELSPEERQTSFSDMIRLALETAISLDVTAINTPSRENTAKANGKFVENNQVVIYNNGKKYTPAGVRK
jgi:purine-nucleoside phosphorylase